MATGEAAPTASRSTVANTTPVTLGTLPRPTVAVLGDSIAHGHPEPPDAIAGSVRSWFRVLVDGVGNYTVPGATAPEVAEAQLPRAVAAAPDLALVQAGMNDAFRGVRPAESVAAMSRMARELRAVGTIPVLVSIPPTNRLEIAGRVVSLNRRLRELARREGVAWLDVHAAVAASNGLVYRDEELVMPDGIHPTREGARAMGLAARRLLKVTRGR